MKSEALWGIDLGGTKVEGTIIVGDNTRNPLVRTRLSTEEHLGYEHILDRIAQLIETMKSKSRMTPSKIGLSHPGVLDPKNKLIKNSNSQSLNGKALKSDLEKAIGIEFILANDANCLAAAEAMFGAAKDASVAFAVILGTGVGGGIVANGKVISGTQGITGEWGHNVLIPDGIECYCGKRGCVETVISGPALSRFYKRLTGENIPFEEIAKLDSAPAKETISHLVSMFARAISVVINILDPDVIVLGGGVSNVPELYTDVGKHLEKYIFNNIVESRIVRNQLGDSAGVFGAAALCVAGS